MLRKITRLGPAAVVMTLMLALPALAQTGVEGDASAAGINYFDFFVVKGGVIAFGLIGLSIITLALTIEHAVSIRRGTIVPLEAHERIKALIDKRAYLDALQYSGEEPTMLGYVVHAGLVEAPNGFAAMERAIEETLDERSARLFRKIEYLNIIGNVAPMIGLLGTVIGMILLFAEIHAADAFPGARIVADKVAIALITTFWGLAVAIPSLSIYGVFRNRIDVLTAECALTVEQLLSVFKPGAQQTARSAAGTAATTRAPKPSAESGATPQPGSASPSTT